MNGAALGKEHEAEGGKQTDVTSWQAPTQRPSLKLPSRVKVPVRRSAEFYRPGRGHALSGSTTIDSTAMIQGGC